MNEKKQVAAPLKTPLIPNGKNPPLPQSWLEQFFKFPRLSFQVAFKSFKIVLNFWNLRTNRFKLTSFSFKFQFLLFALTEPLIIIKMITKTLKIVKIVVRTDDSLTPIISKA